jgi:hypothetical protein
MRNKEEESVITFFREAITQYANKMCLQEEWGNKFSDNEVKAVEIRNAMELNEDQLLFLKKKATEQGFEIEASPGASISTWRDLLRAVHFIIGLVAEDFLIMQRTVDETSLKYWFATGSFAGSSAHGHIGVIKIKKEDMVHLNPEFFDRYKVER